MKKLTTMKRELKIDIKTLTGSLIAVLLLFAMGSSVWAGAVFDFTQFKQNQSTIVTTDSQFSLFPDLASNLFPETQKVYMTDLTRLNLRGNSLLTLLPEHKAYPMVEQNPTRLSFFPMYRATAVLAFRKESTEAVAAWEDLGKMSNTASLGVLLDPVYLASAMNPDDSREDRAKLWLKNLGKLRADGRLRLFNGSIVDSVLPSMKLNGPEKEDIVKLYRELLPPVLILWDYQAAQLNLMFGAEEYRMVIPTEGTIFVDFGLMTNDEASTHLAKQLQTAMMAPLAQEVLSVYGYRQSDSDSVKASATAANLGYPFATDYERAMRIRSHQAFNNKLLDYEAQFKRLVLHENRLSPANAKEYFYVYMILTIAFLIWITFIYYRIDYPQIQSPISAMMTFFGLWIVLHIVRVMVDTSQRSALFNNLGFIPIFGIVTAWYYVGLSLGKTQMPNNLLNKFRSIAVPVLSTCFAVAFFTNSDTNLIFAQESTKGLYSVFGRPKLMFYLSVVYFTYLLLRGFYLMIQGQSGRRMGAKATAPIVLSLILLAYALAYLGGLSILRDSDFLLFTCLGAAFILELSLRIRLIPTNRSYVSMFRHSPNHMRLMNDELTEIFSPEAAPALSTEMEERIISEIRKSFLFSSEQSLIKRSFPGKKRKTVKGNERKEVVIRLKDERNPDIVYGIKELKNGYLIWDEDIRILNELRSDLCSISDQLAQQNRILGQEQFIRSQLISVQVRKRLLKEIEDSLSDQMEEIRLILKQISERRQETNGAEVKTELGRVKIMVSQCKRKSNLLVREEESISMEELRLIFKEALTDAGTSGISGLVVAQGDGRVAINLLISIYDYLQLLLRRSVDLGSASFFLLIQKTSERLNMQIIFNSEAESNEAFFEPSDKVAFMLKKHKVEWRIELEESDRRIYLSCPLEEKQGEVTQ